jgi:ribosomal protein L9
VYREWYALLEKLSKAGKRGGAVRVKKGFAVTGQPGKKARRKAWKTRRKVAP